MGITCALAQGLTILKPSSDCYITYADCQTTPVLTAHSAWAFQTFQNQIWHQPCSQLTHHKCPHPQRTHKDKKIVIKFRIWYYSSEAHGVGKCTPFSPVAVLFLALSEEYVDAGSRSIYQLNLKLSTKVSLRSVPFCSCCIGLRCSFDWTVFIWSSRRKERQDLNPSWALLFRAVQLWLYYWIRFEWIMINLIILQPWVSKRNGRADVF